MNHFDIVDLVLKEARIKTALHSMGIDNAEWYIGKFNAGHLSANDIDKVLGLNLTDADLQDETQKKNILKLLKKHLADEMQKEREYQATERGKEYIRAKKVKVKINKRHGDWSIDESDLPDILMETKLWGKIKKDYYIEVDGRTDSHRLDEDHFEDIKEGHIKILKFDPELYSSITPDVIVDMPFKYKRTRYDDKRWKGDNW
jgi:hypothetical protein